MIAVAAHNVERAWLRRWACQKWACPPTDPRLIDLSETELLVLFYEDAVADGRLQLGADNRVMREKRTAAGSPYFETGDPEIDKLEREWAAKADARDAAQRAAAAEVKATADALSAADAGGEVDLLPEVRRGR